MTDWEAMAHELYSFIIRHCAPSAMTPPGALQVLRKYEKLRRGNDSSNAA